MDVVNAVLDSESSVPKIVPFDQSRLQINLLDKVKLLIGQATCTEQKGKTIPKLSFSNPVLWKVLNNRRKVKKNQVSPFLSLVLGIKRSGSVGKLK